MMEMPEIREIDGKVWLFKVIGKVVWTDGYIFYCKKCDKRMDFAILFEKYPDKITCAYCGSDTEIKEASPRMNCSHPKLAGFQNERKRV